jgi:hypothetical protein
MRWLTYLSLESIGLQEPNSTNPLKFTLVSLRDKTNAGLCISDPRVKTLGRAD